jgi:VanZ family protein
VKRSLLAFVPLAIWAAAVWVVGSLEGVRTPSLPTHADKVAHFVMYGVGGALAAWSGRVQGGRAGWAALLVVILIGAADEIRQTTLETRHGDVWDWVADTAGAIFFYFITARILQRR